MRTRRYEQLRPQEILDMQKEKSIAYLPVGPLEWHGPAMPFGTDPMAAYAAALDIAEKTGGVVLPPVYAGTERERSPEILASMGFEDTSQYIIGQDVPKNTLPSFYFREEIFCLIVREYLRILVRQGYRLIVILNGHGATNQKAALERLAVEFSNETDSMVYVTMAVADIDEDSLEGYATRAETSIQMYLNEENVDLSMLPAKPEKLKSTDWGINSATSYNLSPNEDHTVEEICDPRNSTAELGRIFHKKGVEAAVREINEVWENICR